MSGRRDKIYSEELRDVICTVSLDTRQTQSLGFTLRGGLEYGIGIYVSDVDVGSQAERKGLCKGDRILRVNGHNLKYALQREALALIMARREAVLVVKHSGRLPFIDDESCQLVWKSVKDLGDSVRRLHKLPGPRNNNSTICERKDNSNIAIRVPRGTFSRGRVVEGINTRYGVLIDSVMSNSIGSQVGIERGDELIEINRINLQGLAPSQISILLNDKHITSVRIRRHQGGCILLSAEDKIGEQDIRKSREKMTIFHDKVSRMGELTPSEREYIDSGDTRHSRTGAPNTADAFMSGVTYSSSPDSKYSPNMGIMSKRASLKELKDSITDCDVTFCRQRRVKYVSCKPSCPAWKKQNEGFDDKKLTASAGSQGVQTSLFQDYRSSQRLSPIPESHEFTNSQLKGRTLRVVRIPKNGCDIGIDVEGGVGSVHRGRIVVSKITKYGLVGRNGEIKVGDQILMVNGCNLVDITIPEAHRLLQRAAKDRKDYLEFIVPSRPPLYYEKDSVV